MKILDFLSESCILTELEGKTKKVVVIAKGEKVKEAELQKITDREIAEIDKLLAVKEKICPQRRHTDGADLALCRIH